MMKAYWAMHAVKVLQWVEIHGIANEQGLFGALFGFMGVLAQYRAQIPSENLATLCQTQLVRLFSKQVKTELRQVYLKD